MSRYLKVWEVAEEFNVSDATIYRGIREGKVPHIKVIGSIRVPASWVRDFKPAYAEPVNAQTYPENIRIVKGSE